MCTTAAHWSGKYYNEGEKNESARFLKDVLRFSQEELRKTETGEIFKPENSKEYNYLLDKIEIWGHRTTQGGVDVLDLPKWFSSMKIGKNIGYLEMNV